MSRHAAALVLLGSMALAAGACASLIGIDEPTDRPSEGGMDGVVGATEASGDAGADHAADGRADGPTFDARSDTSLPQDAIPQDVIANEAAQPPDAGADGCVPAMENCMDGIDNDCNGLSDCMDPACTQQGYACVPAEPGGWVYSPMSTSALTCPAGYTNQGYTGVSWLPATCGCSCTVTQQPQCNMGSLVLQTGSDVTCSAGQEIVPTNGGICAVLSFTQMSFYDGLPVSPVGGACSTNPVANVPGVTQTSWSSCRSSGAFGDGCSAGNVCAWVGGASKCVTQLGNQPCPAPYNVTSRSLGSGYSDSRGCAPACGGCTTLPGGSCSATLNFYSGSTCNGGLYPIALDGNCNALPGSVLSYQYVSSMQGASCGNPTQPMPVGTVTLNNVTTACCAP